jgi:tetratricopeptide (TPR) repeat protein
MMRGNEDLRMQTVILLVLGFCFFFFSGSVWAEDVQTLSPVAEPGVSGFSFDINALKQQRAEHGLRNLEPHSLVLTDKGLEALQKNRKDDADNYFRRAKELSPDLPLPYFYLSRTHLSFSPKSLRKASEYLMETARTFPRHFWWSFHTTGMVAMSIYLAFYIAFIAFFFALLFSRLSLFIHDVIENKSRILLLLPSIVLVFFGPIFGIIALILSFWIYLKDREKNVIYVCISILILLVLLLPLYSSFLGASYDKPLRDIVRINKGIYTGESAEILNDQTEYEALFSRALYMKRRGFYKKAISMYRKLLDQKNDAKILNNIANSYVGLGNYHKAVEYYNDALKIKKMASAYYNLSQLYREVFNFIDAEDYYQQAVRIDPQMVNFYNSIRGGSVNQLVMDETFNNKTFWSLAFKRSPDYKTSLFLGRMLTFTNRGFSIMLAGFLIFALYLYNRKASYGAYRCRRCGAIRCSECEKRISREDVCITCFKTLVKVSELGSKERIERIIEIQRYRDSRNRHFKFLTAIVPGSGHVFYGWPVYGFIIMLLCTFFLSSALLWRFIPAPVSMGEAAFFFHWLSLAGLVLIYGFAITKVFRRTPRRWL